MWPFKTWFKKKQKILNPNTGNMVLKQGRIGQEIINNKRMWKTTNSQGNPTFLTQDQWTQALVKKERNNKENYQKKITKRIILGGREGVKLHQSRENPENLLHKSLMKNLANIKRREGKGSPQELARVQKYYKHLQYYKSL
jgi:hypothetical protein